MTSYFPPSGSASNGANTPTASSPLSPPTQRPNALTNRLTSVLSASYADSDIWDSLETLSLRGIHNTAETRRQLRLDVQKEVVDCNAEIVKDFGKVAEQLRRIGTVVSTLNQTCDDMRKRINLAKQDTTPHPDDTKEETETKQQLLEAFSKHFLVPEEDLSVLTSAEEPVDERFFDVLARVKQVHHDCEVLLGGENQRLGLEVMELSTRNLNSAYQKLYRWVQKEFRTLNLEDPRISSTIRRALRVLAERPSLFHSCLDFFAEARDYVLSDAFHYALTDAVSGANGPGAGDHTVKPIEFSAHDPLRYIGDMLAWVHSTTVSEREALESLFVDDGDELARGIQAGLSSEPWSRIDEDQEVAYDGQKALSDLVNRDLTGVSRSLRQRIELVIQSHEDPVTCYKVVNLLSFYRTTFTKLVGAQSHLVDLIQTLEKFTLGHFETLMRDQISALAGDNVALTPPDDLSPPQFLLDALEGLEVLMKTYEASVGPEDSSPDAPTDNPFTSVLRAAFDPFLTLARSSSDELQTTTAQSIYRTNILLTARAAISPFPFASSTHVPPISAALSTLRSDLLDTQHQFLLDTSGLETLLEALEPFSDTAEDKTEKPDQQKPHLADLASLPAFQPESLITSSQQLDDFLPSALMDATDNLKRIQSLSLIQSVTEDAVEAFCRDFEFVEGMIIAADEARGTVNVAIGAGTSVSGQSGKSDGRIEATEKDEEGEDEQWSLRSLFPRTTGEIRVLLS
ncbi:Conserved oligomeric Golgi complex subunit 6 [Penicillium expansum]|nr:Conserved oligomeric Golgi complex subunit 6 [Penicillium expansum]